MSDNIILYGPPGTGKTFFLQKKMLDYVDYELTDDQLNDFCSNNTNDLFRVCLILLHKRGLMRASEIEQKCSDLGLTLRDSVQTILMRHSLDNLDRRSFPQQITDELRTPPYLFIEHNNETWCLDMLSFRNTYPDFYNDSLQTTRRYTFVTFHQSFSYEDFVEGIRPEYNNATHSIDYSPKSGIFKTLCEEADGKKQRYAIFIDEINRGNIPEIFGELISLIESDKRKGQPNELSVKLPYSKSEFFIPDNVDIIGTMNSADKSIGAIDTALRRRFKFKPMLPCSNTLKSTLEANGINPSDVGGIDVIEMFKTLNKRIELLLDGNHTLGHAIFMPIRTADDVVNIIRENVIPLLEEFFSNDLQKIQMVFNDLDADGIVRDCAVYTCEELRYSDMFAFQGDYLLEDKKHYFVNPNLNADCLKHIYGN